MASGPTTGSRSQRKWRRLRRPLREPSAAPVADAVAAGADASAWGLAELARSSGGASPRGLAESHGPSLTYNLIRPQQQGLGDGEAEGLRRFQVDPRLKPDGLLHRNVGRLGSLEDLRHERRPLLGHVHIIRPETQQTPRPRSPGTRA